MSCVTAIFVIGSLSLFECTDKDTAGTFIRDEGGLLIPAQRNRIARINQKLLDDGDIYT